MSAPAPGHGGDFGDYPWLPYSITLYSPLA